MAKAEAEPLLKIFPFLALGLLTLAGCKTSTPTELEPVQRTSVLLNRDLVEKSALKENWETIRVHLRSVDEQSLPDSDKAYALYWMGVVQFKTGQKQSADMSWAKAENYSAPPALRDMIEQARRSHKGYNRQAPPQKTTLPDLSDGGWTPNTSSTPGNNNLASTYGASSQWILQFGIFTSRRAADDCAAKAAWEGLNLQITEVRKDGKTTWIVWSGPHSGPQATSLREKLEKKGLKSLVKNMNSLPR